MQSSTTPLSLSTNHTIQIRVLNASTGVCYPITVHHNELTRENIQRHLAAVVPKNDQILLLGPPYKVLKDLHLRSNETLSALRLGDCEDDPNYNTNNNFNANSNDSGNGNSNDNDSDNDTPPTSTSKRRSILKTTTGQSGSKRIFLFSKQALSETAPEPQPCILLPQSIKLPTEPDPSPIFSSNSNIANIHDDDANNNMNMNMNISSPPSTPLHQALSIYERRFMLHLCQGRTYADASDLRLTSCRNCIKEQAVMVRALRAAVSNLSDHWNNATRTRMDFTSVYISKMEEHGKLLSNFENVLKGLSEVELDKELKAIARVNGRVMESLLDTVPVERMRSWAAQCQTGYNSLQHLFGQLEQAFEELNQLYHREEDGKTDMEAEELLEGLEVEVEVKMVSLRNEQAKRLTKLTEDHMEVVKVVLNAVKDEGRAQAAFTTLEAMSKASSDVIPSMDTDDILLKEAMLKVADAKTDAMKRMKVRLRQISIAQNRLFKVQTFAGSQGTLRDTLNQHCEDMTHLEHLVELPTAYHDFLSEIRRRRAYGEAVASSAAAMIERVAAMRNDEVRSREKFVRGPGRHLMPCFFEMFVPTLAAQPPLFTPQLPYTVEMDTLPKVSPDEEYSALKGRVNRTSTSTKISNNTNVGNDSSSLTEASPDPHGEKMSGITGSVSRLSVSKEQANEKLIVSADEQSANDVIMDIGSQNDEAKAEADAERKTLAYENAILRQTLERLGGKKPKTYLDQARLKDAEAEQASEEKTNQLQSELDRMRDELNRTKSQLQQTSSAFAKSKHLKEIGKVCDKISHSSFEVDDVALFMPTGIGSGGKRTYVAFHSSCPHRFLSTDSIEGKPDYVLGRIVYQEELLAGPVGTDTNPHNLIAGTKFWILTVEVLKLGRGKGE